MDFVKFNPQYSILVCTRCEYALLPTAIKAHLKSSHEAELSATDITAYAKACSAYNIIPPAITQRRAMPLDTLPIPHLKTFPDGIRCQLCKTDTPYICRSKEGMREHLKGLHSWQSTDKGGRPSKRHGDQQQETCFSKATVGPVHCQTFYHSNFHRYFEVAGPPPAPAPAPTAGPSHLPPLRPKILASSVNATLNSTTSELIKQQLAQKLLDIQDATAAISRARLAPRSTPGLTRHSGQTISRAMN
jgi:Orsellinic acid/F9775 biosynthesis cluster protein D